MQGRVILLAVVGCWASALSVAHLAAGPPGEDRARAWQLLTSGQDSSLRGLSPTVGNAGKQRLAVWASGSNGAVLRSLDGRTFARLPAPGDALDFRGVRAFGERTAYLLSSGGGEKSRIYKTVDGGVSWNLQYTGARQEFFLDAIVCGSENSCFALSDPVDGKFVLLRVSDGENWKQAPSDAMPPALKGEGAFAASGTSLALCGNALLFGTGGPVARVFRSADLGNSWTVAEIPIASGNASSGIFSLACSAQNVVAVGGDYQQPGSSLRTAAFSNDGGFKWIAALEPPPGYRSGAAVFDTTFLAVGPSGSDISSDGGAHWKHFSDDGFNAVQAGPAGDVYAAGSKGAVAKLVERKN